MPGKTLSVKTSRTSRGSLPERLLATLQREGMVRAGERVGVAVSGGADSVALLLLLLELGEKLGVVLSVVHFNHKLRGKASDADEKFVAKLAAKHGLEFHTASANVAKKAKFERANLEDAARRARYGYFRALAASGACTRIAIAHTADDQAETVLAHILRGTGLAGLGGIHPIAGTVFRPLLNVRRAELRAYVRERKQAWREDITNRDMTRLRARIRTKLLPLLEKQFQPSVVEHLATLAELAREDEAFFDALLEEHMAASVQHRGGASRIARADLLKAAENKRWNAESAQSTENAVETEAAAALSKRMVRRIVQDVKKRSGQLSARHVEAVLHLARCGQPGSAMPLPGGVEVRKERDALVFHALSNERQGTAYSASRNFEYHIDLSRGSQDLSVPELGCVFRLSVIDWPSHREETNKRETVLDRDRLCNPMLLRNWRPGDRLRPLGHRNAHKLKRLLNEKHISRWERDAWPVVTSGGDLVWARGFPVAADFAANERTRAGVVIAEEPL